MNGEELKQYIKRSGMSVAAVAEELGTSPQNLNAKFNRKSIKIDFFQKIKEMLALGHSFGVRVTDTYINADLSRVDEANRRVIDYVLYNKK